MAPTRLGDGTGIGSIRLGDGTEIAEVRTGAGDTVFSVGLPDAAAFQLDAFTLNLNNNDTVNTWQDQIGSNDATLFRGSPTYLSSGFNNKPTVDMSGNNDAVDFPEFLQSQLSASSAEMAGVILLQNNQNTGADGFLHYSGMGSNEHFTWDDGNYYSGLFRNGRIQVPAPNNLTTGKRFVWGVSSGSTWKSYFNNNLSYEETSNTVAFTPQGPILGAKGDRTSGFGFVSELVIYDRVLTNQERTGEFNRLQTKWGPFDSI